MDIYVSVTETEEYEVTVSASVLARKLNVTEEEILAAVEEGEGDLFDNIGEWATGNYSDGIYGTNTGNGSVEVTAVDAEVN